MYLLAGRARQRREKVMDTKSLTDNLLRSLDWATEEREAAEALMKAGVAAGLPSRLIAHGCWAIEQQAEKWEQNAGYWRRRLVETRGW